MKVNPSTPTRQEEQGFQVEFDAEPHTHFHFERHEEHQCIVYDADLRIIDYDAYRYIDYSRCVVCGSTGPYPVDEHALTHDIVTYDHIQDELHQNKVMLCPGCNATHLSSPQPNPACASLLTVYPNESAIIPAEFGNKFNLIRTMRWDNAVLSYVNPLFVQHLQYDDIYHIPRRYTHWELPAISKVFVLAYRGRFSQRFGPSKISFLLRSFLESSASDDYESIALHAMQCDGRNPPNISRVFNSDYINVHKLLKLYRDNMSIRSSVCAKDLSRSMLVKRQRVHDDAPPSPKRKYEEAESQE